MLFRRCAPHLILFSVITIVACAPTALKYNDAQIKRLGKQMMRVGDPSVEAFQGIAGDDAKVTERKRDWKVVDGDSRTTFFILKKGNKSYPAYIARRLIEDDDSVALQTSGTFTGENDAAYNRWMKSLDVDL